MSTAAAVALPQPAVDAARPAGLPLCMHAPGDSEIAAEPAVEAGVPDREVFRYSYSHSTASGERVKRVVALSGQPFTEADGDGSGGHMLRAGHSTGAALWPAAPLLCDYLAGALGRAGLEGRRVAELGCGLGLVGIVASSLVGAAGAVHLTDGDDAALRRAEANAAGSRAAGDGPTSFGVLRWGPGGPAAAAGAVAAVGGRPFDVAVGSDLVYPSGGDGAANMGSILDAAGALLASEGGTVLIGLQRRSLALSAVAAAAAARGWRADIPAGGFVEDLFGNRTEECSDFWQACVVRFVRGPAAADSDAFWAASRGYPLPPDL
eukprot:tig00000204_g17758.t1